MQGEVKEEESAWTEGSSLVHLRSLMYGCGDNTVGGSNMITVENTCLVIFVCQILY